MDQLRDAFYRVKKDIDSLYFEMDSLKLGLREMNWRLSIISEDIKSILKDRRETKIQKENLSKKPAVFHPTQKPIYPTQPIQRPTQNTGFKPQKPQNLGISTGNEGVPTDRQTDRQTDQQTQNTSFNSNLLIQVTPKNQKNPIQTAAEILDSLDSLKKEIRLKFKRLTEQEILVFSTLYQLDEEKGYADYKTLAEKLKLTESSIRDYVGRLINKGIPVEKKKINNKSISLSISKDLKKVATLPTIMQLINL